MRVVHHVPAPPLDRFVRLCSCETGADADDLETSLPTGELALFINLAEDESRWYDRASLRAHRNRGAVLGGARVHPYLIDGRSMQNVVSVRFLLGGASPFFREPIDRLRGEHIPLEALWRDVGSLRDRLLDAATPQARLRTLEAILRERLVRPLARDRAVDHALACFTDPVRPWRVADVQDRLGMSARRFIRTFAQSVGLTPKRFARVCRFQRALVELERPTRSLAAVAAICGYFDQAHFIHEFRAFAGATPSDHRARRYRVHIRVDRPEIYNPVRRQARILEP